MSDRGARLLLVLSAVFSPRSTWRYREQFKREWRRIGRLR